MVKMSSLWNIFKFQKYLGPLGYPFLGLRFFLPDLKSKKSKHYQKVSKFIWHHLVASIITKLFQVKGLVPYP